MNDMSGEKWWNEICGKGKREKSRGKPTQIPFRPQRNPHGVIETRTRDSAVEGVRLIDFASEPPFAVEIMKNLKIYVRVYFGALNNFLLYKPQ